MASPINRKFRVFSIVTGLSLLCPLPVLPQASHSAPPAKDGACKDGGGCSGGGMMPPPGMHNAMFMVHPPGMGPMMPPPFPGGPGMPPPPPGLFGPMMIDLHGVDLSEEQQEKMAALKEETMDKVEPIMVRIHSLERQYREALVQDTVNSDQLNKLQSQIGDQKQALDAAFFAGSANASKLLTVEQRHSLRQKMTQMQLGIHPHRRPESNQK